MMQHTSTRALAVVLAIGFATGTAAAQTREATGTQTPSTPAASAPSTGGSDGANTADAKVTETGAPAPVVEEVPDDTEIDPAQPDFTLVSLPTGLRAPRWRGAFRVTHRFTRSLGDGNFGDLVADGFGTDFGALIGLEFRLGLPGGLQAGVQRTSDKTIKFFGQHTPIVQHGKTPVSVAAFISSEAGGNFQDLRSQSFGVIVSRKVGRVGAVYAQPFYVRNTNLQPGVPNGTGLGQSDEKHTAMIGIGGRFAVRKGLYLVGEVSPRLAGFREGVAYKSFALEKLAGGHVFQLNFSNALSTTLAQVARGATNNDTWYFGFNISRKFY